MVQVPSVLLPASRAGMIPSSSVMVCVPMTVVRVPDPGSVAGIDGSVHVYVAAPDIFNPSGNVPGRRLEKSTLLIGAVVLLFERVISSCVVSPGLIEVGCPLDSVTEAPRPA